MLIRSLVILATVGLAAGSARAESTCDFDEASGVATLTIDGNVTLTVVSEAITFNGEPCGSATTTSTARIVVLYVGNGGYFTLKGTFAPGRNDVPETGVPEIEIDASGFLGIMTVIGSSAAEEWRFTAGGINLNGDLDEDVTTPTDCLAAGRADLVVTAGGGDDVIDASARTGPCLVRLRGGGGDDVITGTARGDVIMGDGGNDTLYGRAGQDMIEGGAGDDLVRGGPDSDTFPADEGADDYRGGAGVDVVGYGAHTVGITVTIDGVADDGAPGEGDNVHVDVENVSGTDYDDVLVGSSAANDLYGDEGNDEIHGGPGDDSLRGGFAGGADILMGEGGDDYLYGGDGDDFLAGGAGADDLHGISGNDILDGGPGVDAYDAGTGDDTIYNADSFAETIDCGDGVDDPEPDPLDTFVGCEDI